jgi:mono/diheme cytochrome c family protein
MKRGTAFLLAFVLVLAILAAGAASFLHDGLSARAQPSALETALAAVMRKLAMPSTAHNAKNPVTNSPEVLREGRLHFADHCAICHGNDGSGETAMGRGMYPKPPDLRAEQTQNRSDGDIFWIIENGVRLTGMPAFGGKGQNGAGLASPTGHDNSEDSWKLVHFIRHLPSLTAEERIEMEKYNPKGPEDLQEEQRERDFLSGAPEKPSAQQEHHHH